MDKIIVGLLGIALVGYFLRNIAIMGILSHIASLGLGAAMLYIAWRAFSDANNTRNQKLAIGMTSIAAAFLFIIYFLRWFF